MMRHLLCLIAAAVFVAPPAKAVDITMEETLFFAHSVFEELMPPVNERVPEEPYIVDFESRGRTVGKHGGEIEMLIGRAKDVRYMVVYGYSRLVGYDENFELKADILESVQVEEGLSLIHI